MKATGLYTERSIDIEGIRAAYRKVNRPIDIRAGKSDLSRCVTILDFALRKGDDFRFFLIVKRDTMTILACCLRTTAFHFWTVSSC